MLPVQWIGLALFSRSRGRGQGVASAGQGQDACLNATSWIAGPEDKCDLLVRGLPHVYSFTPSVGNRSLRVNTLLIACAGWESGRGCDQIGVASSVGIDPVSAMTVTSRIAPRMSPGTTCIS